MHTKPTALERAILFATLAHKGQMDEDGQPHIVHSLDVMFALKRDLDMFKEPIPYINGLTYSEEELMIAAVCHDVVEDTKYTLDDIHDRFGAKVAVAVNGVTRRHADPCDNPINCKDKKHEKEPYRNLIYRAADWPASKLLKLSDLGCNRRRTHTIKQAKWRNKLEYKYDVAIRFLSDVGPKTWEQASWRWQADPAFEHLQYPLNGHFYIADPNGKEIRITMEQFEALRTQTRRTGA